jgi:hypothetical protein
MCTYIFTCTFVFDLCDGAISNTGFNEKSKRFVSDVKTYDTLRDFAKMPISIDKSS